MPLGAAHQRHELRLEIGRKARKRLGRDIDRTQARAVSRDPNAFVGHCHRRPGAAQRFERDGQQFLACAGKHDIAAGHCHRHRVGAGFDAVGQHRMPRAMKLVPALNADRGRARAFDRGAHSNKTVGDVLDLRLACSVFDQRLALRERRSQKRGMGRAHRNFRE